mgnify:CR=1 FL=1
MKNGMTISQIANHNRRAGKESGIAYFSKENMKMFDDRLSNYKIMSESPTGCVLWKKSTETKFFYDKSNGRVTRI